MFKFQVMSDTHVEFMSRDERVKWARTMPIAHDVDALVIAGDFGTCDTLYDPLAILIARVPRVIYIAGNHEFYGSSFERTEHYLRDIASKHKTFTFLENDTFEDEDRDVRIHGTTLWFPRTCDAVAYRHALNDFRAIVDATPKRIFERAERAGEFLRKSVRQGDIVITHHLPTYKSVARRFAFSALNAFYVNQHEHFITRTSPAVWVHGHTHSSQDYLLKSTRIVCNPRGYKDDLNPQFDAQKVVCV